MFFEILLVHMFLQVPSCLTGRIYFDQSCLISSTPLRYDACKPTSVNQNLYHDLPTSIRRWGGCGMSFDLQMKVASVFE